MKHTAPKVNNSREASPVSRMAGKLIKHGVSRIANPFVQAIVEEMEPEIDSLLSKHVGDVDLSGVGAIANRAGSVLRRVSEKRSVTR
jgi:hypothetical protein